MKQIYLQDGNWILQWESEHHKMASTDGCWFKKKKENKKMD